MTDIQILGMLIGVAIGTPIGILIAHALLWLWDEATDWTYDIWRKIRDRRH